MSDVKILDGNTFVVSDERGDIEASLTDPTGLFSFDTRFLSKWVLTVDGQRLNPLSVDDLQYFETRFFLVPGTGTVYIDAKLSVIRQRAVGGGFHEELTLLNHDEKAVDLEVRMEAGSDFADLFEVKDALKKKGEYYSRVDDGRLVLGYRRETFVRETWISATAACDVDEHGLTFSVHLEPQGEWTTDFHVTPGRGAGGASAEHAQVRPRRQAGAAEHGAQPREVARGGAAPGLRLGSAQADVPAQPRRSRGAALLAGHAARPPPAGRRSALVPDDVRPRQHLHQPAGAAVHARARARRPSWRSASGRGRAATTSATRTRAGSCTRCASAR